MAASSPRGWMLMPIEPREGARVFHMDEVDVHFWLDERHQVTFDPDFQTATAGSPSYRKDTQELNTEMLFSDFLREPVKNYLADFFC